MAGRRSEQERASHKMSFNWIPRQKKVHSQIVLSSIVPKLETYIQADLHIIEVMSIPAMIVVINKASRL